MRVSKVAHAVNLRYAIGELLLIVVGILIALAISDWHERGSQRERDSYRTARRRCVVGTRFAELD